MSEAVEFSGVSPTGDFQDALNQAIFSAMGTLKSEAIEWTLLRTNGTTAERGYRSKLTVTISAKLSG